MMKRIIMLMMMSTNLFADEIGDVAKQYLILSGKPCPNVVGVNNTVFPDEIEIVCANNNSELKVRYVLDFKTGKIVK
jgi:hypothetical protein